MLSCWGGWGGWWLILEKPNPSDGSICFYLTSQANANHSWPILQPNVTTGWIFFFLLLFLTVFSQGYLLICCRGRRQNTYFLMVCISNHVFFLLSHVIFFLPSHDFFPLPSVLISVFLCQYPSTLLFPGTFSDSLTGSPTNLWAASASPILAWLWHYQHHLSVSEKSTNTGQQEKSSQIFTCVPRRHTTETHQTFLHHTVGITSIKM